MRVSRKLQFDVVHCHDFDTLPLGLFISELRGVPVLYDAHELYSEMIRKDVGKVSDLVWWVESRKARVADELITVNEKLAEKLSEGRKTKARIVTNSPDTGILEGLDVHEIRKRHNLGGFVISYLGSLEPGRFVEELVSSVGPQDKVSLAIGGNGTLMPVVSKAALANPAVKFLGTLDTDEALRVTWASDLVIAMLDPGNPNYRVSTPVKVLDAMACGRAVVVSSGLDISKKVEEVGCGFVIPYDKGAFRETILKAASSPKLLQEMGRKGKEYYDKELSWERSRNELLKAYKALADRS